MTPQTRLIFEILSGLINLAGFAFYVFLTINGRVKPEKASWTVWAVLDAVTALAMLASGTINGLIIGTLIGSSCTAVVAFNYGKPGWSSLDKYCLAGAFCSLFLWILSGSPKLGVLISLLVMTIGSIPTFRATWIEPQKEHFIVWALFTVGCLLSLLAVPDWTKFYDSSVAQPVVFTCLTVPIMGLVCRQFFKNSTRRNPVAT